MRYEIWYMNDKGVASLDNPDCEIKDESTVTQDTDKPVPIFDSFPEHTPPEGFFLVRLKEN